MNAFEWDCVRVSLEVIKDRLTPCDTFRRRAEQPHSLSPSFCLSKLREVYRNDIAGSGRGTRDGNKIDRLTYTTLTQVAQILCYKGHPLMAEQAIASMFDGIAGVYIRK